MSFLKKLLVAGWLSAQALSAHATIEASLLKPLAGEDPDARIEAIAKISALANEDAYKVLMALRATRCTPIRKGKSSLSKMARHLIRLPTRLRLRPKISKVLPSTIACAPWWMAPCQA